MPSKLFSIGGSLLMMGVAIVLFMVSVRLWYWLSHVLLTFASDMQGQRMLLYTAAGLMIAGVALIEYDTRRKK